MKNKRILQILFQVPIFFILLSFFLVTSCGKTPKRTMRFVVKQPLLAAPGIGMTTTVTGALPIHISVRVENLSGAVLLKDVLSVGSPSSNIKVLPVGPIKITTGFLAQGLKNGKTVANYCSNHTGSRQVNTSVEVGHDDDTVLYSETTVEYNINPNSFTDVVNLVYPPFSQVSFSHFGFKFVDQQGVIPGAVVRYIDPISQAFISDPCDGTAFFDVASQSGILSTNLPVWRADKKFQFLVTDPRIGQLKAFTGIFTDPATQISFQKFNFFDGTVFPMNNSDTYLSGTTIGTRISEGRNPRFPDFLLTSYNYYVGNIYPFNAVSNPSNSSIDFANPFTVDAVFSASLPRDPIRNRKIFMNCRVSSIAALKNEPVSTTNPYVLCDRNNFASTLGFVTPAKADLLIIDEDGYAPFSDCSGQVSGTISCSQSMPFSLYVSPLPVIP